MNGLDGGSSGTEGFVKRCAWKMGKLRIRPGIWNPRSVAYESFKPGRGWRPGRPAVGRGGPATAPTPTHGGLLHFSFAVPDGPLKGRSGL